NNELGARLPNWAACDQLPRHDRDTRRSCPRRTLDNDLSHEKGCHWRLLSRTLRLSRELQPILVVRELCLARRLSPLLFVVIKMNNTTPIAFCSYLVVATL